jgi:hypothetical protein
LDTGTIDRHKALKVVSVAHEVLQCTSVEVPHTSLQVTAASTPGSAGHHVGAFIIKVLVHGGGDDIGLVLGLVILSCATGVIVVPLTVTVHAVLVFIEVTGAIVPARTAAASTW